MSIFQNACKPKGLGGRLMLSSMNFGHGAMAAWGFQFLKVGPADKCLDLGCGGGANLKRLLELAPRGIVKGVDYSPVSVEKSQDVNRKAIAEGRCQVLQGDVMDLIFAKKWFDVVTAFETVYFWPDITRAFRGIREVLADDGVFLICNETDGSGPNDRKWAEKIDGMTVYNPSQLEAALREAGFSHIEIHNHDKHWLAILARK